MHVLWSIGLQCKRTMHDTSPRARHTHVFPHDYLCGKLVVGRELHADVESDSGSSICWQVSNGHGHPAAYVGSQGC